MEALAPLHQVIVRLESALGAKYLKRDLLRPYQSLALLHEILGNFGAAAECRDKAYFSVESERSVAHVHWAIEAMLAHSRARNNSTAAKWRENAREMWRVCVGDMRLFNLLHGPVVKFCFPE